MLLKIIHKVVTDHPCHVLYYVLMGNHYHLVFEMLATPISSIMQHINQGYSRYYNRKYHRQSTVFDQRYKSYPVSDMAYLFQLLQYLAYNPVRAGIVKHPAEYLWCAHLDLVTNQPTLVARHRLFALLGNTVKKGAYTYAELIRQPPAISQPTSDRVFAEDRRLDHLGVILQELIGERATLEFLWSGNHSTRAVHLRRKFVSLARVKGYKASEIARVLRVSERCVRRYSTMTDTIPAGPDGSN